MRALDQDYRPGTVMYNLGCAYALMGERDAALSWLMKASKAGFDVGGFAKEDRDLGAVRDEPWLAEKIADMNALAAFALPIVRTLAAWPAQALWREWLDRFSALAPRVLKRPDRALRVLRE